MNVARRSDPRFRAAAAAAPALTDEQCMVLGAIGKAAADAQREQPATRTAVPEHRLGRAA